MKKVREANNEKEFLGGGSDKRANDRRNALMKVTEKRGETGGDQESNKIDLLEKEV